MSDLQDVNHGGENSDNDLDLFTEQDIVDRIVNYSLEEDLYSVVFWIKRLDTKDALSQINDGHSETTMTAVVAAASKSEPNRTRNLILLVLRAKGGRLPRADEDASVWLADLQPWAIELLETEKKPGESDERDALYLLSTSDDDTAHWIGNNLPLETGSITRDDFHAYRSNSLPAESTGRSNSLPARYKQVGGASTSNTLSPFASSPLGPVKPEPREPTLPPITEPAGSLGILDLTDSRSPSPVSFAKPEPNDAPLYPGAAKGKGRATDANSLDTAMDERALVRIDNLPRRCTDDEFFRLCANVDGVIDAQVQEYVEDVAWGLVTVRDLSCAREVYKDKTGKMAPGGIRPLDVSIYSSTGIPIQSEASAEPAGEPSAARGGTDSTEAGSVQGAAGSGGQGGGERYAVGFSGGSRPEGERGPTLSAQDAERMGGGAGGSNNGNGNGNGYGYGGPAQGGGFHHPGPPPFQGRFMPRPRTPFHFTAAELARRVYLGGLPFNIPEHEVMRIFTEIAKVKARVLRVKNDPLGTHAFAFIQHPDSITADFAIKALHGQVYDGHLLQVEHANELARRWLFSLTLYGFPVKWEYRDVSDFLISTIGSFAGLRVSHPYGRAGELSVRVELRYETELRWAANELNGLLIESRAIRAEVDQLGIRRKIERELAYERLQEKVTHGAAPIAGGGGASGAQAYGAYDPSSTRSTDGYDPNYPAAGSAYATGSNGVPTPGTASRSRPAPPPPPPPPAKRTRDDAPSTATATTTTSARPASIDDASNPFSPRWLYGGGESERSARDAHLA
ncbi:hypothetical protein JCM10212_002982 [Sporobolomyces blumeae]